jgi:hypothetical protein
MLGVSVVILRLQKKIPGTMRGSMQWSPLQLLVLSLKVFSLVQPTAQSHEWR